MDNLILTFLFTDLENSTRLWEQHPEIMQGVMARHDELLRLAVEENGGVVVKTTGDGLHAVFHAPAMAAAAAIQGQRSLQEEKWPEKTGPVSVRMGLHTGESQERDGDYYGPNLNRAARIMSAGHGGQVLLSDVTAGLVADSLPEGVSLFRLGEHNLRDLSHPVQLFQLNYPQMADDFPRLKTLSVYKHNLPQQLTSFVGRKREMTRVKQALQETRLLTLLGPGGTGKTRLMLQIAADVVEDFKDGVWLVELAPLADPALILDQAARVFEVKQQSDRPMMDTIADHLRRKAMLVLLDNVEHLVADSAVFVEHLLRRCPQLKILVTGRESLFIEGEVILQIPSLKLPAANGASPLEQVQNSDAVQLFIERASAVRSGFALDEQNRTAILEIVHRLDGIPLAIELAAARVRSMSLEQIAERLNDRFRLLTGGRRTAMPRQQTLQALIEWSWNLLEEEEQILLRRLSVFSGGWDLEAAEEVNNFDGLDVFDSLDQLVSKSLVIADMKLDGRVRYKMLESIHQFARDRLFEAGEAEDLRNRHLDYFTGLLQRLQLVLRGEEMLKWQKVLIAETENLRSARDWSIELGPEKALDLVGIIDMTVRFWSNFPELNRWWDEVLEMSQAFAESSLDKQVRKNYAGLLVHLGSVKFAMGHQVEGERLLLKGINLSRELGELRVLVYGLGNAILSNIFRGETASALTMNKEAIEISRREKFNLELILALGSMTPSVFFGGELSYVIESAEEANQLSIQNGNPWLGAMAEHQQARISMALEKWDESAEYFARAAEKFRIVGDIALETVCLSDMAHMRRSLGDLETPERIYPQTIDYFYEGRHMSAVAHQLESFGYLAIGRNRISRAAVLFGAASRIREEPGYEMILPPEITEYQTALEKLEMALGEKELEAAMDKGRRMYVEQAIDYAKEIPA